MDTRFSLRIAEIVGKAYPRVFKQANIIKGFSVTDRHISVECRHVSTGRHDRLEEENPF